MIKIMKYGEISADEIFTRNEKDLDVSDVVSDIISDVRKNGDNALFAYGKKFDKADLTALEVAEGEIEAAFRSVEPEFIEILKEAAQNIRAFHENQVRQGFCLRKEDGTVIGQR